MLVCVSVCVSVVCVCVCVCVCVRVCVCVCVCRKVTHSDILADVFHGGVGRLRVAYLDTASRGVANTTKTLVQRSYFIFHLCGNDLIG